MVLLDVFLSAVNNEDLAGARITSRWFHIDLI